MRLTLDYGRTGLPVTLPGAPQVLELAPEPPLDDPAAAVRAALADPIGSAPLAEVARGRRDACIVICDITRPVPNALILGQILPVLAAAGVPAERVTVLIATGTHRPNEGEELFEMLGESILSSGVRIVNHDCTDPLTHRSLGISPNGVPIALDTRWLDADLKLTVGLIEPHFMAGYSGGRKLIMPGIAALESVQTWHSPRFLEHPRAANGIVEGNPVHAENLAIARRAPADFLCDVTIDAARRVTGVFAGHMERAWEVGVAFVARQVRATVPEPVDLAVTSGGGYPLDATFYQVVKGIVGAVPVVKPGGTVVIAAALSEGIGSAPFRETLARETDLQDLVRRMAAPDWRYIPDQWQIEMLARATRSHRIVVVGDGVSAEALEKCHVTPAETVEAAVARYGGGTIAAIPKGPYVIAALSPLPAPVLSPPVA